MSLFETDELFPRFRRDENGNLVAIGHEDETWKDEQAEKRELLKDKARGLIRSVVLAIDLSSTGVEARDFGIHRVSFYKQMLEPFIVDFFDENPISQMSIIATFQNTTHTLTPMCGSLEMHLQCIRDLSNYPNEGHPSMQNILRSSWEILKIAPSYSTREVLVLYGSLMSNDVTPLDTLTKFLHKNNVRVNVIGLGAHTYFLQKVASETGGQYSIPMSSKHLENILKSHLEPPALTTGWDKVEMIRFGFASMKQDILAFDIAELTDRDAVPKQGGMSCPKCGIKVFALPTYCPCCCTLLLTPAHIARASIHFEPLEAFDTMDTFPEPLPCCGCHLSSKRMFKCRDCGGVFCSHCNDFLHNDLHHCPICLANH